MKIINREIIFGSDKTTKVIRIVIYIGSLLIFTPILFFFASFRKQNISENISDWGVFGDFFGGILNPIISLVSLTLIAYITILLSRKSNEENKKLYILQNNVEAYNRLNSYLSFFIRFETAFNKSLDELQSYEKDLYSSEKKIHEWVKQDKNGLINLIKTYIEFHSFLLGFKTTYSHFFDYFYKNKTGFDNIMEKANNLNLSLNKVHDTLLSNKVPERTSILYFHSFIKEYTPFLFELKSELRDQISEK